MKRQHPDNPDLFWCSKCETYKTMTDFFRSKEKEIQSCCKICSKKKYKIWADNNKKHRKEYLKKWKENHPDNVKKHQQKTYKKHAKELNLKSKQYNIDHPEMMKSVRKRNYLKYLDDRLIYSKEQFKIRKELLTDTYINMLLKEQGLLSSPEAIELKREQIQLWRELKQIKQEVNNGST